MKYYYSRNGEPVGPLSKDEIAAARITPDTFVWTEGMEVWVPAREMPMLADVLDGSCQRGAEGASRSASPSAPRPAATVRPRPAAPGKYDFSRQSPAETPAPASRPQPDVQTRFDRQRPAPVQYYAIINDIKVGPMFIDDMRAAGVKRDTLVWKSGLAQWQAAGTVSELQPLFAEQVAVPPYGNAGGPSVPPPHAYDRHSVTRQTSGECLSYTTASVFAIILGAVGVSVSLCGVYWNLVLSGVALACGIMGCVKSSESSRFRREGRMPEAIAASKGAKSFCTVSFVLAGIGIIVPILLLFGLITLFAAADASAY